MLKQFPKILLVSLVCIFFSKDTFSQESKCLNVVAELDIGESESVTLANGENVTVALTGVNLVRDSVRNAIREAFIDLVVDGKKITLGVGNYNLPVVVGKVKIDCPTIKEFTVSNYYRHDGILPKDARVRLWPKDSPFIQPGTFGFPLKQSLFANRSQSQNELAGLGWAENPKSHTYGYHATHDFGGAEGMDEIISATDGIVISSNKKTIEGIGNLPGDVRPDVVWIVDNRDWYYRYSHLDSVDTEIVPGAKVSLGQKIGTMGKQGWSGGWVHLHFGVHKKNQETNKWQIIDATPYFWEAYVKKHQLKLKAIARPKKVAWTHQEVKFDGSKSLAVEGEIVAYEWTFTDGTKAIGPVVHRRYPAAGEYSEILKVTDSDGNVDYDFAVVQVFDKQHPEKQIPTIHAAYHPSLGIKAGDPVTFLVRTFGSNTGNEVWDFGDGSEKVSVNSGVVKHHTQNQTKYAETVHVFSKPGHYVVRVERSNDYGFSAIGHVHVKVK